MRGDYEYRIKQEQEGLARFRSLQERLRSEGSTLEATKHLRAEEVAQQQRELDKLMEDTKRLFCPN
jgi:hypothetical protein